jgi:hypothetical protein
MMFLKAKHAPSEKGLGSQKELLSVQAMLPAEMAEHEETNGVGGRAKEQGT